MRFYGHDIFIAPKIDIFVLKTCMESGTCCLTCGLVNLVKMRM